MREPSRRSPWPQPSPKRLALGVARLRPVRTSGGRTGQWWTPAPLAQRFVEWARIRPTDRVLDAGAGRGALGRAAIAIGAEAVLVERDRRHANYLERELGDVARVVLADFLADDLRLAPRVDVVISNPPWEGDLPELFIARALELARRGVFMLPLNVLCGVERSRFWCNAPVAITRARAVARRPRFLGAKGGMRDVVFLEIERRRRSGPQRFVMEVGDA